MKNFEAMTDDELRDYLRHAEVNYVSPDDDWEEEGVTPTSREGLIGLAKSA